MDLSRTGLTPDFRTQKAKKRTSARKMLFLRMCSKRCGFIKPASPNKFS